VGPRALPDLCGGHTECHDVSLDDNSKGRAPPLPGVVLDEVGGIHVHVVLMADELAGVVAGAEVD